MRQGLVSQEVRRDDRPLIEKGPEERTPPALPIEQPLRPSLLGCPRWQRRRLLDGHATLLVAASRHLLQPVHH